MKSISDLEVGIGRGKRGIREFVGKFLENVRNEFENA